MPILASAEIKLVFLVIAGIVSFVQWLAKRSSEQKAAAAPRTPRPSPAADPDAERKRQYMAALGVGTPAKQIHTVLARPAPPPLPPPRQRAAPAIPPARKRVEQIHFDELRTPEVPEFHTHSGDVSAIPTEAPPAATADPYAREHPAVPDALRAMLGTRAALRSAFVLREILGPPRGLQS